MPLDRRLRLLELNFKAMAPWGQPRTYSSPSGFHPRDINPWLEAAGVRGFYHTGEGGCSPTHAWLDGVPFGGTMWAFPVSTLGASASSFEFKKNGVPEAQVEAWFKELTGFCSQHREARMVYGHSVDFGDMPTAYYEGLLRTVDAALLTGQLRSWTLADYADFQDRRLQVKWSVATQGRNRILQARGPLRDMAFQVPGSWQGTVDQGVSLTREDGATWIVVKDERAVLEVKLWP
jgi:hypothetical protein